MKDDKIVMTLDAGGTNFVFSAIKAGKETVEPVKCSARQSSLHDLLNMIIGGFDKIKTQLGDNNPVAISFSFPGPAEYEQGIIGDLQNLPLFRGGVALGPMLQEKFGIPVFINNDGDLFAYGEAIAGLLPHVNRLLEEHGNPKRYKNIMGVTFGTGFGCGIVSDGHLLHGDNSAGGEINRFSDVFDKRFSIEESTTIKAIKRLYSTYSATSNTTLEPFDIYNIATGKAEGNKEAAIKTFKTFAEAAGTAIANAISLVDGIVVLGGGIANAYSLFISDLVATMRKPFITNDHNDGLLPRLETEVYNLEDAKETEVFLKGNTKTIQVPFSDTTVTYDAMKRIGVGVTRLGTEKAVAIGAYYYAINNLK